MHVRKVMLASSALLCVAVAMIFALVGTALANLPDHRVFEMVSPVEKGGQSFMPELALVDPSGEHALVDGGVYNSLLSNGVSWMRETRTPTGWSGVQVGPPSPAGSTYTEQRYTAVAATSKDLSRVLFQTELSLEPRDLGSQDIYMREGSISPFMWLSQPPAPAVKTPGPLLGNYVNGGCNNSFECESSGAILASGSSDLSTVVWSQRGPLVAPPEALPGAPVDTHAYGYEVYASAGGGNQLVGLVPAAGRECDPGHGSCIVPRCGAAMGNSFYSTNGVGEGESKGYAPPQGQVSEDGSQVVFESPDPGTEVLAGCGSAQVYVREGGDRTVAVSLSQKTDGGGSGGTDSHGPQAKLYVGSAGQGGRITTIFFTSREELTNDANTGTEDQGDDLYAYSLASGQLTDLTPDVNASDAAGADVVDFLGASSSLAYFIAEGVLAPGASAGQRNIYVRDLSSGRTTFVANGSDLQTPLIGNEYAPPTWALTPDGQHLVFLSSKDLTAYKQEGKAEIYLYDEPTNGITCVSCNPSGEPPFESLKLPNKRPSGGYSAYEHGTLPLPRMISDDGSRVFFDSGEQLTIDAPTPVKGLSTNEANSGLIPNLYEYENGHVYLIAAQAQLAESTPSGNDVLFQTGAQLTPQDDDGTPDIYDARVGGGFPALAPPACSGTSCQGVPASPPIFATPPSVTFTGVGNFPPAEDLTTTKVKAKHKAKSKKPTKRRKQRKQVSGHGSRARSHGRSNKGGK